MYKAYAVWRSSGASKGSKKIGYTVGEVDIRYFTLNLGTTFGKKTKILFKQTNLQYLNGKCSV